MSYVENVAFIKHLGSEEKSEIMKQCSSCSIYKCMCCPASAKEYTNMYFYDTYTLKHILLVKKLFFLYRPSWVYDVYKICFLR